MNEHIYNTGFYCTFFYFILLYKLNVTCNLHSLKKYKFAVHKWTFFTTEKRGKARATGAERDLDRERKDFTLAATKMVSCIWYHLLRCTCAASVQRERERVKHPLLNGNSCASATAAVWHFRWPRFPLYSPLELAQTTMASHQKRRQENQTLLSVTVEISVQGGKGGTRPLASLPCQPAFYYWKHTHTYIQLSSSVI